jgi:hypothetical protein
MTQRLHGFSLPTIDRNHVVWNISLGITAALSLGAAAIVSIKREYETEDYDYFLSKNVRSIV